jgi:hypothetical protein
MSWLVPDDVDDCSTSSPFLYLTLATLGPGLSTEPAVRQYVEAMGLRSDLQKLAQAVSAGGVRVRDYGLIRNDFDDNLHPFTPEEIWVFDLAIDVIAMLGCADGLPDRSLALFKSNLRNLDEEVTSRTWKHQLKKAGNGPAQFHELRAKIPRHTPHPSY